MRLVAAGAVVLLQLVAAASAPNAEPKHMKYERAVLVPAGVSGTFCAVLDAAVFAHAESRSADDLRMFDASGAEVPFALTENEPQPDAAVGATVENLGEREGAVVFDLAMPARAYSEVDLDLDAKDFVASAEVSGVAANGEMTKLGTFTLFDLTRQHLSRSTTLPLVESTFPKLHVVLRNADARGVVAVFAPSAVRGASVPPSREAQALYTTVAETSAVAQQGRDSVASFRVAAHVPVERVRFELQPGVGGNFVREVSVAEGTDVAQGVGEISRTKMSAVSMPMGAAPINEEKLSVDAVLAGNLRETEQVTVSVHNGDDKPLPLARVLLEMRQRKICFAASGANYVLRYGDAALRAPVYDYARMFDGSAKTAVAMLGAEQVSGQYAPRADLRSYTERHPELIWIALIGVVAILGATAVSSVKHQGRG